MQDQNTMEIEMVKSIRRIIVIYLIISGNTVTAGRIAAKNTSAAILLLGLKF